MNGMKDAGHLLRFALLFVVAFVVFLALRHMVVPKSFGQYGHYRGAAIAEMAARPVHYAGHEACETCHAEIAQTKSVGRHAGVNCEACHGPLAKHAGDPSVQPAKLNTAVLCVGCHAASAAKPAAIKQIEAEQHSTGLACETCHKPHSPALEPGGEK